MQNETPTLVLEILRPGRPPERRVIGPGRSIIGRESGDLVLHDPESSAIHAEIELSGGRVIVRDLGSSNGTWRGRERLPQFALFAGQSFRCGATEIRLVAIEGVEDVLSPGRTAIGTTQQAVGDTKPGESVSTLVGVPSPAGGGPDASAHAVAPPSSTATAPGTAQTQRSSGTLPGPPPFAAEPIAPGHPPIAASDSGMAAAGPVQPGSTEAAGTERSSPDASRQAETPAPASVAPAVIYRPPVANAVIKEGSRGAATPRAKARPRAVGRRSGKKVLARIGWVLGIVALVGGLGSGVAWLWRNLQSSFAERVARTLPEESLGLTVFRSPRAVIELFGEEIPSAARDEALEVLGVDPFELGTYEDRGIDVDAPWGLALLRVEPPVVALSLGVSDRDALDRALREDVTRWLGRGADEDDAPRWVERRFGDREGLWLDGPLPMAALPDRDRITLVAGFDERASEAVVERTEGIADLQRGKSLADRPGFRGLAKGPGEAFAVLYVDGPSSRSAVPGSGLEAMAVRMALADIDGFASTLSTDGSRIHLGFQTVLREESGTLKLLDRQRDAKALDSIPHPVLAEIDVVVSRDALEQISSAMRGLSELLFREVERDLREELGIDLRAEIIDNLDGSFGWALTRLPEKNDATDLGVVGFVSVRDEKKARETGDRIYARAHERLGATLEQVAGVDVFRIDGPVPFAAFVHAGHVWVTAGSVDVAAIVDAKPASFRKETRHRAIAEAVDAGGLAAGFLDIRETLHGARPSMGKGGRKIERELAPVLLPLEVLTLRTTRRERAVVTTLTLHTELDEALPELVQRGMKLVGQLHEKRRETVARLEKCMQLEPLLTRLLFAESALANASAVESRLREMCETLPADRLDCYLKANALSDLRTCEVVDVPRDTDTEPPPVPYVDDLWPRVVDPGTGRPDENVNYAVDLGTNPQLRGPEDALVTIVQFGDFQCPYCRQMTSTLDQVLATRGKEVRLVYRHFPLDMHPQARLAARAAIAAGRQDAFWAMHDRLYERQNEIDEAAVRRWAGELGLDLARFDRDFHDAQTERQIDEDLAAGKRFGVRGTPSFFVNGRFVSGTQSREALEKLVEEEKAKAASFVKRRGDTRLRLYEDMIAWFAPEVRSAEPVADPTVSGKHIVSTEGLPSKGSSAFARVQIIECADFDCPYCARVRPTIDRVLEAYPTQVVFFFAHNPLSFHPGAEPAARAAVAAAAQDKFWEMHDRLFETPKARSQADFEAMAAEIGLDVDRFARDMNAPETAEIVREQQKRCTDNEATATPSFFINGRLVTGAQTFEAFKALVDEELAGGI